MENHHQAMLKSHIDTLSQQEKSNVKAHINAAGDDHTHSSAATVTKWVGGIICGAAVTGLSWKAIKSAALKHL